MGLANLLCSPSSNHNYADLGIPFRVILSRTGYKTAESDDIHRQDCCEFSMFRNPKPLLQGLLQADFISPRPPATSAICVRREKAALSSGCKSYPANAPAGSNRSSHGGDEMAEAFGVARHI